MIIVPILTTSLGYCSLWHKIAPSYSPFQAARPRTHCQEPLCLIAPPTAAVVLWRPNVSGGFRQYAHMVKSSGWAGPSVMSEERTHVCNVTTDPSVWRVECGEQAIDVILGRLNSAYKDYEKLKNRILGDISTATCPCQWNRSHETGCAFPDTTEIRIFGRADTSIESAITAQNDEFKGNFDSLYMYSLLLNVKT